MSLDLDKIKQEREKFKNTSDIDATDDGVKSQSIRLKNRFKEFLNSEKFEDWLQELLLQRSIPRIYIGLFDTSSQYSSTYYIVISDRATFYLYPKNEIFSSGISHVVGFSSKQIVINLLYDCQDLLYARLKDLKLNPSHIQSGVEEKFQYGVITLDIDN